MNPIAGWLLVALALWAGWRGFGGPGIAMAFSVVVFWLLLQYSQAMRVMRLASRSPIGHIDSAVMLNAKLRRGMTMLKLVALTRSLGRKIGDDPERFEWADPGGSVVQVSLERGRLVAWELRRPPE
jgi:hypothetical protein